MRHLDVQRGNSREPEKKQEELNDGVAESQE